MDEKKIKDLIRGLRSGEVTEAEALSRLRKLPFSDLGHTKVDHHRALRQGAAEVIFAEGKRVVEIISIIQELLVSGGDVLVTRVTEDKARTIKKSFRRARYNPLGRTVVVPGKSRPESPEEVRPGSGKAPVAILSGGTADAPVVEEAKETLLWLGIAPAVIRDVGVAGIHRLLAHQETLESARVLIVVAGMEGALASVVAGLTDRPVIGVPTSVGYGTGAGGFAALLGMLNSCATGVCVMNIDNGFGAAGAAARILRAGSGS